MVVDGEFLTDTPYNLLQQGLFRRIPTILGVTSDEGYLLTHPEYFKVDISQVEYSHRESFVCKLLAKFYTGTLERLCAEVAKEYIIGNSSGRDFRRQLSDLQGDHIMKFPTFLTARLLRGKCLFNGMILEATTLPVIHRWRTVIRW